MGIKNTYFLGIIFPPSPFVGTGVLWKIHSTVIRQYVLRINRQRGKIVLRFYGKNILRYIGIYNKKGIYLGRRAIGKARKLSELREFSDNSENYQTIQTSQKTDRIIRKFKQQK